MSDEIIKRIQEFALSERLNIRKLSALIGFNYTTLNNYCNKRRGSINIDLICKLVLNFEYLSPDWLLNGRGDMLRQLSNINKSKNLISNETIGKRINKIIDYNKLNISSFAKSINMSQPTMRSIILEKTNPSYDTLKNIIVKYNINAEWLLMGTGEISYSLLKKTNLENKIISIEKKLDILILKNQNNYSDLKTNISEEYNHEIMDRFRLFIKTKARTIKKFSIETQISENTLKSLFQRNSAPTTEIIIKTISKYPDMPIKWILTGFNN